MRMFRRCQKVFFLLSLLILYFVFKLSGYQQSYGYEYGSPYQPNRPVYPPYGPDGDRWVHLKYFKVTYLVCFKDN